MDPYALLIVSRSQSWARRLQANVESGNYLIRWVPSTAQATSLDMTPSLVVLDLPPSGGSRCATRLKQKFEAPLVALTDVDQPPPEEVEASAPHTCRTQHLVELIQATVMSHLPNSDGTAGISLDTETRQLRIGDTILQLRPIGCRILSQLLDQMGHVVPREELVRAVWGADIEDHTRALDVHIAYLRRLLETNPRRPRLILTVRGVGYRFQPPD
jgi:DNA-binding response OmpR family regulator